MRWVVALALLFLASAAQAQVSPVPPIIAGTLDLGTGTTVEAGAVSLTGQASAASGYLTGLTGTLPVNNSTPRSGVQQGPLWTIQTIDPSTLTTEADSDAIVSVLTGSAPSNKIWQSFTSFTYIQSTGALTGEVNGMHSDVEESAGANATVVNSFETQNVNFGGTVGTATSIVSQMFNNSGTIGTINGVSLQVVNNNVTPGSISTYTGIDFEGMSGSGAQPTYLYLIRNNSTASISTLGGINIGFIGTAPPNVLSIFAAASDGSSYPFIVQNKAGTKEFMISDTGEVLVGPTLAGGQTCSGTPTSSFATINGIVTHC